MRKILIYVAVMASAGILLYSCQKEEDQTSKTESFAVDENLRISSDGTMLIFNTLADYEKIVNDPTDELRIKFINTVQKMEHITYAENRELNSNTVGIDLIDDAYLAQILNKDNVVQIGTYLYLVDMAVGKCYALPAANKAEYADLVNKDTHNANIKEYSTTQDVLYITQGNDGEDRCGGVGSSTDTSPGPNVDLGLGYTASARTQMTTAAVFFSLKGVTQITPSVNGLYTLYLQVKDPEGWRKRRPCNSGTIGTTTPGDKGFVTTSYKEWEFYSGSRNLNGYYFFVRAKVVYNGQTLYSNYGGRNINSPY
jgi:hypothetical protein